MVYGQRVPRPEVIERVRWFWQLQGKQKGENSKREKTKKSTKVNPWATACCCCFPFFLKNWTGRKQSRGPARLEVKKWTSEFYWEFFSLFFPVHWFQLLKTWIELIWTFRQAEISVTVCSAYVNFPTAGFVSKQSVVYIKSILVKQNGLKN